MQNEPERDILGLNKGMCPPPESEKSGETVLGPFKDILQLERGLEPAPEVEKSEENFDGHARTIFD